MLLLTEIPRDLNFASVSPIIKKNVELMIIGGLRSGYQQLLQTFWKIRLRREICKIIKIY